MVEVTEIKVEGGTWRFQGWDADMKVIDSANLAFIGTWIFEANPANETEQLPVPGPTVEDHNTPATNGVEPKNEAKDSNQEDDTANLPPEEVQNSNSGVVITIWI